MRIYFKFYQKILILIIILSIFIIIYNGRCINIKNEIIDYDLKVLQSPLIFIGGFEGSGTTLIRAILDVHDSVFCGPETKIIPHVLNFVHNLFDRKLSKEIISSGISFNTVENALGLFIFHIMNNHVRRAPRLCAKDPLTFKNIEYLHRIFPNAKFVYMVRNGRGAAFSLMKRKNITNNFENYMKILKEWDLFNYVTYKMCLEMGKNYCKIVKYEDLVEKKETVLRDLTNFLNLEWTDNFLNHEKFINTKILISDMEFYNHQINRSIYKDSLFNWKGNINGYDDNVIKDNIQMLKFFGY